MYLPSRPHMFKKSEASSSHNQGARVVNPDDDDDLNKNHARSNLNVATDGPPFQLVNPIELDSFEDGDIDGVSLYPSRTEITRLFHLGSIAEGRNQVNISGLPAVLDKDSLLVSLRTGKQIHLILHQG